MSQKVNNLAKLIPKEFREIANSAIDHVGAIINNANLEDVAKFTSFLALVYLLTSVGHGIRKIAADKITEITYNGKTYYSFGGRPIGEKPATPEEALPLDFILNVIVAEQVIYANKGDIILDVIKKFL